MNIKRYRNVTAPIFLKPITMYEGVTDSELLKPITWYKDGVTEVCRHCKKLYNPMFLKWRYINLEIDSDMLKAFYCPHCNYEVIRE